MQSGIGTMPSISGSLNLGTYRHAIDQILETKRREGLLARIAGRDHTVWKPAPHEIADRLGWLDCPYEMEKNAGRISRFVEDIRNEGFKHVALLGMGGSSMAPEMFLNILGNTGGYPEITVIDTTDPAEIIDFTGRIGHTGTLFIVSTKSGTTIETLSLFKYFYRLIATGKGNETAGGNFIAITDPQSPVASLADDLNFRDIFLNDPHIGGRYSALSFFGMVPAALIGADIKQLLAQAQQTLAAELSDREGFSAFSVGIAMAELAKEGRNKATFIFSPGLESMGDWLEQLIAESTGKEGRGIIPIVREPQGIPDLYDDDRVFISVRRENDRNGNEHMARLEEDGHPVIRINMDPPQALGGFCCFWEMATAVAGHCLAVNPFDQPDVDTSKRYATRLIEKCAAGNRPEETPAMQDGQMAVFGDVFGGSVPEALLHFLESGKAGDYVAIQAYLKRSAAIDELLQEIRCRIRDRFLYATTSGYGPRYLHSTGQIHKGDAGRGLFVQLTADTPRDIPIPETPLSSAGSLSFGMLRDSQAHGDYQALSAAGRRIIRIHIHRDITESLDRLARSI